jgi:hypothetical protein
MKRIVGFAVALALTLPARAAGAACITADQLVQTYGISFSGFKKEIPKAPRPLEHGVRTADLVVIRLPNQKGDVPDGFAHSALINKDNKQAWIRRKGGFVPVDEWYGPVKLETVDLGGCVVEPWR